MIKEITKKVCPFILSFLLLFGICNILFKEDKEKEHGWGMHSTNCNYCDEVRKNAKVVMESMDQQIQLEFWLEYEK